MPSVFLFIIPVGWNADVMVGASAAILDHEDGLGLVEGAQVPENFTEVSSWMAGLQIFM